MSKFEAPEELLLSIWDDNDDVDEAKPLFGYLPKSTSGSNEKRQNRPNAGKAELYCSANTSDNKAWMKKHEGIVTIGANEDRQKTYFIRLYSKYGKLLWEHMLDDECEMKSGPNKALVFKSKGSTFCLQFSSLEESDQFKDAVNGRNKAVRKSTQPSTVIPPTALPVNQSLFCDLTAKSKQTTLISHPTKDTKAPKSVSPQPSPVSPRSPSKKQSDKFPPAQNSNKETRGTAEKKMEDKRTRLSKTELSSPTNFEHKAHIGWSKDGKSKSLEMFGIENKMDDNVRKLLIEIGYQPEDMNKADMEFVYDFIEDYGGISAYCNVNENPPPIPPKRSTSYSHDNVGAYNIPQKKTGRKLPAPPPQTLHPSADTDEEKDKYTVLSAALQQALVSRREKEKAKHEPNAVLPPGIPVNIQRPRHPFPTNSTAAEEHVSTFQNWAPDTFEKDTVLGGGHFGKVYKCWDPVRRRHYVAKKTNLQPDSIKTSLNEVKRLKDLHHPRIIEYYGYKSEDDGVVIFMEYMPLGSIYDMMIKHGPVNEGTSIIYIEQILDGLVYLHNKFLVHSDLKCDNLLSDHNGNIKIGDFGLAVQKHKNEANESYIYFTTDGMKGGGTAFWTDPEFLKSGVISRKSDIWSLGCTIVEMLTTTPPYFDSLKNKNVLFMELGAKSLSYDPKELIPKASESMQRFVGSLLQINSANRPADANQATAKYQFYFHSDTRST